MSPTKKPTVAVVLSLAGGLLIALTSILWLVTQSFFPELGWLEDIMRQWELRYLSSFQNALTIMTVAGLVFGGLIILSALLLYRDPSRHELWGTLIVVFSIMGIVGFMGGLIVGVILGIIGGMIAILWKPEEAGQSQ